MDPLNIHPEVVELESTFRAIDAGSDVADRMPGIFAAGWPAYRAWFLREGESARASYAVGAQKLRKHLPELFPTYERLVDAVGGGDLEARFLSHWCPPPLFAACSMATFTRGDKPTRSQLRLSAAAVRYDGARFSLHRHAK